MSADMYPLKIDSQAGHIHFRPGLTLYPGMGRIGYLLFCLRCMRRKEPSDDLPGARNRAIHFAATFGKLAGLSVEYSLGHRTND